MPAPAAGSELGPLAESSERARTCHPQPFQRIVVDQLSWAVGPPPPVPMALQAATEHLRIAGCPSPRADAELLLAAALNVDPSAMRTDCTLRLTAESARVAAANVQRRAAREPVEYILGRCEYRGLELHVRPGVIVPSEERTSLLFDLALALPSATRIHDVGTGCGAIALALKHERPDLVVTGSDLSGPATRVARGNASWLGLDVKIIQARNLPDGTYDLVLANPPYGRDEDLASSAPPEEALHQPHVGLVAGGDGLSMIRELVASAVAGTRLAIEHGPAQGQTVGSLLTRAETRVRTHPSGLTEQMTVGVA